MHELISSFLNTQPFIEEDLLRGTHTTFDKVVEEIKTRTGMRDNIFSITGSYGPQIDIFVEEGRIYRLSLADFEKDGNRSRYVSIWMVDKEGFMTSGALTIDAYSTGVSIAGADRKSPEYKLEIKPADLAGYLDRALGGLQKDNWKFADKY